MSSDLKKSTVVDESVSVFKPMFCFENTSTIIQFGTVSHMSINKSSLSYMASGGRINGNVKVVCDMNCAFLKLMT